MMRSKVTPAAAALCVAALMLVGRAGGAEALACGSEGLGFGAPVRLGTGRGYEPGIEVDSDGTIYVTAHKLALVREEGTRLSSYLWRSDDGGQTWGNLWGPAGSTQAFWSFEGDLAVDAADRLYFVDTWAADNHFFRYAADGTLELARPAVATYEADDRPWLAAHQDGYVYYLSNTLYKHDGRLTIHRSTNGGLTFDPIGYTFPQSGWGFIDADPNSDYVYGVMNDLFYATGPLGEARSVWAHVSPDRGQTWSMVKIADYEFGWNQQDFHDDAFPTVAVSPVDGTVYALWTDDGKKLMLARSADHGQTWETFDVTPFGGWFSYPWVAVSPQGDVGIIFEADPDAFPGAINWVYAMVWRPTSGCLTDPADPASVCGGPSAAYGRLDLRAVGQFASQLDFNQVEFLPDGSLVTPWTGVGNAIMFVRQTAGPNLGGPEVCGIVGSP